MSITPTFMSLQVELELIQLTEGLAAHGADGRPLFGVSPPHVTVMCRVRGERLPTMLALHQSKQRRYFQAEVGVHDRGKVYISCCVYISLVPKFQCAA